MFNSYHVGPREVHHRHENKTTVNEHRAPTDDSIRIYDEMRRKAEASILCSLALDCDGFRVEGVVFQPSPWRPESARLEARFSLGRVLCQVSALVPVMPLRELLTSSGHLDGRSRDLQELRDAVLAELARKVAVVLYLNGMKIEPRATLKDREALPPVPPANHPATQDPP